jgi:hypothetical protein
MRGKVVGTAPEQSRVRSFDGAGDIRRQGVRLPTIVLCDRLLTGRGEGKTALHSGPHAGLEAMIAVAGGTHRALRITPEGATPVSLLLSIKAEVEGDRCVSAGSTNGRLRVSGREPPPDARQPPPACQMGTSSEHE